MTWRTSSVLVVAILCPWSGALCGTAMAQATQPAVKVLEDEPAAATTADRPTTASWSGVAQQFVTSLAAGDVELAWTLLGPRARLDEFDPDAPATFARIVDLAKRATLLGVHPYETSPTMLAEDIAADVRDAPAVPEDLRRRMMPADEDEAARANATAAQWLVQNLAAEKGDPLAAVVLWDATDGQVVFILLKGQKIVGRKAGFQITHIVFGNPLIIGR